MTGRIIRKVVTEELKPGGQLHVQTERTYECATMEGGCPGPSCPRCGGSGEFYRCDQKIIVPTLRPTSVAPALGGTNG